MNHVPQQNVDNAAATKEPALEVEQKYRVETHDELLIRLAAMNASELPIEQHCDTYLQHPCRDFAISGEALRIRTIGENAVVTYKGARLAGPIKIRTEIELPLADQTQDQWLQIWLALGFQEVAQVRKRRRPFSLDFESSRLTITLDDVDDLGKFVEIEAIVHDRDSLPQIQNSILLLAAKLELDNVETRSYLRQILEKSQ